jgi:hypothetical protein
VAAQVKQQSLALYLVTFTVDGQVLRVLEHGNTPEEAYECFLAQLADRVQDRSAYTYMGGHRWPRVDAAAVTAKKSSPTH